MKLKLLEADEEFTITDEERIVRKELKEIVKYMRQKGMIPVHEKTDYSILSLRKALQISNISNLSKIVPSGAFRMSYHAKTNKYILSAWIRLCQNKENNNDIKTKFEKKYTKNLINEIKNIMCENNPHIQKELIKVMGKHGIDFSIVKNFQGAPVQGYISLKDNGIYHMVLTLRGSFADIFWFSLFHEIGHIVNGDIEKTTKFIDYCNDTDKEEAANLFAANMLPHKM